MDSNDIKKVVNVFIDGDKNCFISKSSIQKFKQIVKTPGFNIITINELSNRFMKPGFKLICYENKNKSEYKFKICNINSDKTHKDKLRIKINELCKARKHGKYHKPQSSNNTDKVDVDVAEIYKEYNKLIKLSKIPIPEPKEILENPDQYKPIISMVLSNNTMSKLGKNHPYVRYFTLLANKIGVLKTKSNEEDRETIQNGTDILELKQVVGNTISNNSHLDDVDTEDTEDELDVIDTIDTEDELAVVDTKDELDVIDTEDELDVIDTEDELAIVDTKDELAVVDTKDELDVIDTEDELDVIDTEDELAVNNIELDI